MRSTLLIGLLLSSLLSLSQKVVVEEKFEKDNVPLGYSFLEKKNQIVIHKGKHVGVSTNREIHDLISFDSNGNKKNILEGVEVMNPHFSINGNTFLVVDYAKMSYSGSTYKIIKDGKSSKQFDVKDAYNFLVDDYQFNIENDKGKSLSRIKFESDDLFLNSMNVNSFDVKKIKLDKPDISRLIEEGNVKYAKDLNFIVLPDNDKFEIITKSIKEDYKSMILYRTIYNFKGEKIKDLKYNVEITENHLMYCNNEGGNMIFNSNGYYVFEDDLSINNFIKDDLTNDIYVYGLIGKKDRRSNFISNDPLGYYIFKFSENGEKIWESINMISDKKDFNGGQTISKLMASLKIMNNKLLFLTGPETISNKDFLHYSLIEMSDGSLVSETKLKYKLKKSTTFMSGTRDFILSFMYDKENLKNKRLDYLGLIMYNEDSRFKKYIDSIDSKKETFFHAKISGEAIWLIESDNETYYKLTYFD